MVTYRSGAGILASVASLLGALAPQPAGAVTIQFERDLAEVEAGASVTGRAVLEAPATAETCLALASSNAALATVPATLAIPAGQSGADFRIQVARTAVAAPAVVSIQVTVTPCAALPTAKRAFSVLPPASVAGVLPSSAGVQGGGSVTLQVKLNRPAAWPGVSLALANNSNGLLAHPKAVTVPAARQDASVTVTTQPVVVPMTFQVSAAVPGASPVASTITLHGNPGSGEPAAVAGVTSELNKVRATVGVPPLRWNSSLAATAQKWASSCTDQSPANGFIDINSARSSGYPYAIGETLFGVSGSSGSPLHVQAVNAWASEASAYNPATGDCNGVCSNYTQVVWRSTLEVGCGTAVCPQLDFRQVLVCNYAPAGNNGARPY